MDSTTKKEYILSLAFIFWLNATFAQDVRYTGVNAMLFNYTESDVHIQPPEKHLGGKQILSPNPQLYPWEERLDNGMPNAVVDPYGNVAVYFSSFLIYSPTPPSKVGVTAFTNNTYDYTQWERPSAQLYWYNNEGTTADEKISSVYRPDYQPTNIVAVDLESFGIYDDGVSLKPIQTIYKAQRDFQYRFLGSYPMSRSFSTNGVLSGFSKMKIDRASTQATFTFKEISADTHMNMMYNLGDYYFTSRMNARRSTLNPGEIPPFTKDPRTIYRRNTLSCVGPTIESKNVDFDVVLDNSTEKWEPYSMQPFRMPGFENDSWLGLVTMFGLKGFPDTEKKQRTELAISDNGKDWRFLKSGVPFLDNGTASDADDFGCINVATPVYHSKLHGTRGTWPYFFYASSNSRHVEGRNSGLSLAMSKYGKIAGLTATTEKTFYSVTPATFPGLPETRVPLLSVKDAFAINAMFYPQILGDITDDPTGKALQDLNSCVQMKIYSYDNKLEHGLGMYLGGARGSAVRGTHDISDNFEAISIVDEFGDSKSKENILGYLRMMSSFQPQRIISFKEVFIPVVIETKIKNAILYGVKFGAGRDGSVPIDFGSVSQYKTQSLWTYKPTMPTAATCQIESFANKPKYPNIALPTCMNTGAIALHIRPTRTNNLQTMISVRNNSQNYVSLNVDNDGSITYDIKKSGEDFVNLRISPPSGLDFYNKDIIVTVEAVKHQDRKYNKDYKEEVTIMRVSCQDLGFEEIVTQPIIWNAKQEVPTKEDSCNARGFAYLPFTSIVGGMDRIVIGGSDDACSDRFMGTIYQIQVSDKLPTGTDDFWNNERSSAVLIKEENSYN